jgi:hypothetical protein
MTQRALCFTGNHALRRTLRRTLQASGAVVEFADESQPILGELDRHRSLDPDLIVFDAEARKQVDFAHVEQHVGKTTQILIVGESLEADETLGALRHPAFNHLLSELADPDEDQLVVTSGKVGSRDIFGLEKYLAWGALVHERSVHGYSDKRNALLTIATHAEEVGARRALVAKIESVTDELLMNALYDAPALRWGVARGQSPAPGILEADAAFLRWACDGRYFAVSVRDNYGELRKEAILDHLARAREAKGMPKTGGEGRGAGLGLFFVMRAVTRFIANIHSGQTTEVICLFDIKTSGRAADPCAKSLHIFTIGEE